LSRSPAAIETTLATINPTPKPDWRSKQVDTQCCPVHVTLSEAHSCMIENPKGSKRSPAPMKMNADPGTRRLDKKTEIMMLGMSTKNPIDSMPRSENEYDAPTSAQQIAPLAHLARPSLMPRIIQTYE
jgi:hypothetical protein